MNSLLKKSTLSSSWLKNALPAMTPIRTHWNKDYKPGPYPQTEEERIKAANKYGIHVREYEAYPDDGDGAGDYPKLPLVSAEAKDPFYPWDSPELKRNFQETLHEEFDLVREDRYNYSRKLHLPLWVLWLQTVGTLTGLYIIYHITNKAPIFLPVVPPQLPEEGKVHYTFETP